MSMILMRGILQQARNFQYPPTSQPHVYVAGNADSTNGNKTVRKFTTEGIEVNIQNPITNDSAVGLSLLSGIAVDSNGNIYVVGTRTAITDYGHASMIKYDSNGSIVWVKDHGSNLNCITIVDDLIYVGGETVSGVSMRKYNAEGDQLLTLDHGITQRAVFVDTVGNIYIGGGRRYINWQIGHANLRKFNSSGTEQWIRDTGVAGSSINDIFVDDNFNVYAVGTVANGASLRKYNSAGTPQFTRNHGATVFAICSDGTSIYISGDPVDNITTRQYSYAGVSGWTYDHGFFLRGSYCDNNTIYLCGTGITHRVIALNTNGTLTWGVFVGNTLSGITVK